MPTTRLAVPGPVIITSGISRPNVSASRPFSPHAVDFDMAQRADTASGLTLSGQKLGTPG